MNKRQRLFLKVGAYACLVTAALHHQNASFMRAVAAVDALGSAQLLVVGIVYFFPPPIACFAVMLLGFAGSLLGKTAA